MPVDDVTFVLAAVAAGLSAVATVRTRNVKILSDRVKAVENEIGHLYRWKYLALQYISALLGVLASHGITPPTPPEELGLPLTSANLEGEHNGG